MMVKYGVSGLRIAGYKCDVCSKSNVKLWRLNNVLMSQQRKLCIDDAARRLRINVSGVRNSNVPRFLEPGRLMVPAVPLRVKRDRINNYWLYDSVPEAGWRWWDSLPLR